MVECGKPTTKGLLHNSKSQCNHREGCRVVGFYEKGGYPVCYGEYDYLGDHNLCSMYETKKGMSWRAMVCEECVAKYFW